MRLVHSAGAGSKESSAMTEISGPLAALVAVLDGIGPHAVALSGGVDSLTLASAAHTHSIHQTTMFHAVSPAVPVAATARVTDLSNERSWDLTIVDANEFNNADYMANPVDRCFYCKSDLYGTISGQTTATVVSGTNLDDLADYRPGLEAADQAAVRHPFVEAAIDKETVRQLATELGLGAMADLPAAPCLSSRVETGLAIDAEWLRVIDAVETQLSAELSPKTVRCRARADRIAIELDKETLSRLSNEQLSQIQDDVAALWQKVGVTQEVVVSPYRMGSAFLKVLP
jgi:uncharacterized protein